MNSFLKDNKPLVILEMANNHMGDFNHAKKIIKEYSFLTKKFRKNINFAIKFQFRDLETYLHKDFLVKNDKYVSRFVETQLSDSEWVKIVKYAKLKFITICTPFDEISVKKIIKFNFDYLKIASCSMDEWPLLECIAKIAKKKKIISSLGGGDNDSIRNIISFFSSEKRKINIRYLYCVAKYPTLPENLNLSFFNQLKEMYGDKVLGFSTHEDPDELISVSMAFAMGARIFEKHIAVETNNYKKNAYSVNTSQFAKWIENLNSAIIRYGSVKNRDNYLKEEKTNLSVFKRGVYLNKGIVKEKGEELTKNDYFLAFPALRGQLQSNDLSKYKKYIFKNKYTKNIIYKKDVTLHSNRKKAEEIRNKIIDLIKISKVVIKKQSKLEISHHYGVENFYKYGLSMITIHNEKYCKKLLFLLENQLHPDQFHKKKQETFFVLFGKVKLFLKEKNKKIIKNLSAGDTYTIKPYVLHKFIANSKHGAIIEELSTFSSKSDSFYVDKKINRNKDRKTFISIN
jgi:sialic acid synthase SpsE/D-lyxose ketol-isomerase